MHSLHGWILTLVFGTECQSMETSAELDLLYPLARIIGEARHTVWMQRSPSTSINKMDNITQEQRGQISDLYEMSHVAHLLNRLGFKHFDDDQMAFIGWLRRHENPELS